MSTLLYALGRWSYRHPWRVLVAWLLLLGIAGGGALVFMKGTDNSFSIPGTEAQDGALPATIQATATHLRGQRQAIATRELRR